MSVCSLTFRYLLSLSFAAVWSAPGATIFTTDTLIGANDATYDGQDLVVSNAVLTVDGSHTFNSLRVAAGAMLTHSDAASGSVPFIALANELYQLNDTNPVTLVQSDVVPSSFVVTDTNGLVTYTNAIDYVLTNVGASFTLQRTTNSFIPDGDTVFVSYEYLTTTMAGLIVTVTTDLEIEPGARVDADGRGFGGGAGTGAGGSAGTPLSGGGAGHAGYGGSSSSNAAGGLAYGGAFAAGTRGSGGGAGTGGAGGSGGGLILLWVGSNCVLNGSVTANGQNATNSRSGGGSGGGISITAPTISGTGTLSVRGGAGEPVHGGGGGGGRIALNVQTNDFTGTVLLNGGPGWQRGGAGLFAVASNSTPENVTIDNGGFSGAMTPVDFSSVAPALEVRGRATVAVTAGALHTVRDLIVRSNSTLTTTATNNATLNLSVIGDALIEPGATVLLRGAGYPANLGPGAGGYFSPAGGGGGYGGYGGNGLAGTYLANGGNSYGSATQPPTFGSGGRSVANFPGGAGGGAVRLTVRGRLQLEGQIIADGTAGSGPASGGGAGGGILLTLLGELAGNGLISANGGSGGLPNGGGGAGGRIGVNYNTNSFTGTMTAFGGAGFMAGGAGTILTKLNSSSFSELLVNNGGLRGTNTPSDLSVTHHLTISGGAICRPTTTGITLASVTVGPNSVWQLGGVSGSSPANFTVLNNLTVAAGGLVSGDGLGYTSGQGPGAGAYSSFGSTGGGHGGMGGRGLGFTNLFSFAGGNAYDTIGSPTQAGSGGGGTQISSSSGGGAGGGAIRLGVSGELRLDGRISVNGNSALTNHGGGGAGGGLWLALNRLSGAGAISADGGNGYLPNGGGGGGGRIAVTWSSNSFSGTYSAKGGNGFVPGAAGPIYLKPNNAGSPSLIFDNGGLVGTNTVLDVPSLAELHIRSGASVTSMLTSVTVSNLNIGANGVLGVGSMTLNVSGSVNIAAGGILRANATSSFGSGNGQSSQLGSGGGGHGGYGGRGFGTTGFGGNVYGSTASPSLAGSRGGVFNSAYTAAGGGYLRLNVTGPLIVDGVISANGAGAVTNADGGGSGGSIWLTLNQFSGAGTISANGGSGHLPNGGGGGGGRIAITYFSNAFTGSLTARGGPGYGGGGAGTIYLRRTGNSLPTLVVDNGGLAGTNTLLTDLTSLLDLNVRSGASVTSSLSSLTVSNLNIEANAALRVSSMTLSVGTATIAAGGALVADGVSSSGLGAGQAQTSGSGGGGHGGYGGRGAGSGSGGNVHDTTGSPSSAGGPGGGLNLSGGRGGGLLRLNVSGLLLLDGKITADGSGVSSNSAGGGAGGTVALTLNRFSGSGLISADGGGGHLPNGGGGGGGRIAVTWLSNAFTGLYSAKGGNGFQAGGAGTLYLKPNSGLFQTPSLIVDNGGLLGTNTTFELITLSNLTVGGGAVVRPTYSGMLNLSSLNIASNGTLLASQLNLSGPAHVLAGGRISADGQGSGSGLGIGPGGFSRDGGGGGGHGGFGGRGYSPLAATGMGGNAYDLLANPTQAGSGGGGLSSSGGSGGGVIRITATGPFTLDGRISANGLHSVSNSGGGGAGGSVILTLTRAPLLGAGTILADGGNGHLPNGGGGGGGRIAVSYLGNPSSNGFLGTFSARGGSGFMKGGAGTTYLSTNNIPQAIVDNGGARGTNTSVASSGAYDLTVQGGAVAVNLGNPRDVLVRSNAWLSTYLQSSVINVTRDVTFDVGGGVSLNVWTNSQGGSSTTPKAGGGHGGYGGFQFGNSGNSYDSAISPSQSGSPGGNGSGSSGLAPYGGAGGGMAQLVVGRTLRLDGDISADGRNGEFNSGGGAGGGLRLQAVTFAGNGRLTANGGNGNGPAGGGGGGRIAVTYTTNLFTGIISACGGSGGQAGGAGTIFLRDNLRGVSSLLLDNCGVIGASTPFSSTIGLATNLTVSGNAVAEAQGTIPVFSNLVVTSGSSVTARRTDTNLHLALLGDLTVAGDSRIFVDGKGFALTNGPGAGESLGSRGAGGGYGGAGGASASGAIGGDVYGSAARPVDRGSGGGRGAGVPASGSEGGGAIRLAVAGTMTLDGLVSANGATGLQDDSGGGSGGSVWITARQFTGAGALQASGGAGEFYGGGGGGGGRVAVYSPMNTYTGLVSVAGGGGAFSGATGTVFTADTLDSFGVLAQTPVGVFSNALSQVTLEFNTALNPLSIASEDFAFYTPNGLLASADLALSFPAPATVRVSFPMQNLPGDYRLEAGPAITDLFGAALSQVHTGVVTLLPPMISGIVTDTNGQPVAGVWLQPSGGLLPTVTDSNGYYALGVPLDWNGSVTPSREVFLFAPGARSYAAFSGDLTNENYLMLESFTPALSVGSDTNHLRLNWSGYAGITYQVFWTTNLSAPTWYPLEPPLAGTNGLMEFTIPISAAPEHYFRLRAGN